MGQSVLAGSGKSCDLHVDERRRIETCAEGV